MDMVYHKHVVDVVGNIYYSFQEKIQSVNLKRNKLNITVQHYRFKRANNQHLDGRTTCLSWVNIIIQLVHFNVSDCANNYDLSNKGNSLHDPILWVNLIRLLRANKTDNLPSGMYIAIIATYLKVCTLQWMSPRILH